MDHETRGRIGALEALLAMALARAAMAMAIAGAVLSEFTKTDVYINASSGSDVGDGSATNPWKTNARLFAAIGLYGLVAPIGNTLTIHYVGATSPPQSDPFNFLVVLARDAVVVRDFSAIIGQTIHTGAFSAVRTIDHATNVAPALTDAAIPSWAPYVGKRLRVTSGTAITATAIVLLAETATRAETSLPCKLAGLNAVPSYPAPGDTYVLETLPTDWQGAIDLKVIGNEDFNAALVTRNATLGSAGFYNSSLTSTGPCLIYYAGCIFPQIENAVLGASREYAGCGFLQGLANASPQGQFFVKGCGVIGVVSAFNGATITLHAADTITESGGFTSADGGVILVDGSAGAFNSIPSIYNTHGDGFSGQGIAGLALGGRILNVGIGAMYGKGNAGVGWRVGRGQTDLSDVRPTVTGAGGDFALDAATTAFAFDPAAAAYVAPAKVCSWANMNLAAQLNGQAHAPQTNSHLLTVPGS